MAGEIHKRIAEVPGIHLGERPNGDDKPFDVKLPFSIRDRHVYIIGRSGGGKTNLIRSMILQDAYYGRGVGVIAPEAELLKDEILPYIPENRIDDVIYIDPSDTSSPISFNPLYIDRGEDRKDDEDNGIDLKVDDALTVFKRLMGETGARMDEILRQSLYALMQRPGSTLLDLEPLLDEFQTFMGAAASYSIILSRARKYKLCLCIGHQQTGQIPQNLLEEIFGNVSTLIAFNVAHKDATRLSNEYVYEHAGNIEHVQSDDFLRLRQGEAIVKIERNVLPVHVPLLPSTPNRKRAEYIIDRSYQNYSKKQSSWYVDIKPPDVKRLPPKKNDDDDPTKVF